jgi:hypothetical protein
MPRAGRGNWVELNRAQWKEEKEDDEELKMRGSGKFEE